MILIDGRESNVAIPKTGSLDELLHVIVSEESLSDRTITDVLVNNEPFSELYPYHAEDIDVSNVETLELKTISKNDMVLEVFTELPKVVKIMIASAKNVAENMRCMNETAAFLMLSNILEVNRDFLNVFSEGQSIYDFSLDKDYKSMTESMSDILEEIMEAIESKDYSLAADLIEYEYLPLCEQWIPIVDKVTEEAKKMQVQ